MKGLLLDQGLAPAAASTLRDQGLDAIHVMEVGMHRAEDVDILEFARNVSVFVSLWITISTRIWL